MNIKNFSLDYIQPGGTTAVVPQADPWAEAVNYYGPHILRLLQAGGSQMVQDLFERVRSNLNVSQLQLDQFVGVVDRMILSRQLVVTETGKTPGEAKIGLPVPA